MWCLVSSLIIHFVSGLLAWYSLGGHPIAVYALPSFIVAGFFTPLFAGTVTSELRDFTLSLPYDLDNWILIPFRISLHFTLVNILK